MNLLTKQINELENVIAEKEAEKRAHEEAILLIKNDISVLKKTVKMVQRSAELLGGEEFASTDISE